MKRKGNKYHLLLWFLLALTFNVSAQGKINMPLIECYKNITQFSYTPPTGLTLSSATWEFGDGSSSGNNSPQYVYKNTGTYKVKVTVNLSNGSTRTDTASITVVPLPNANFDFVTSSDTCLNNNSVCFKETSTPGNTGQTIVNRLAVWGDGKFDNQSYPSSGQTYCHTYSLPDKYLVKIEITDMYGCKASKSRYVSILEQTETRFSITNPFKDCKTKLICIKNQSTGKNKAFAKYYWNLSNYPQDTNRYFTSQKCFEYTGSQSGSIRLKVLDANGCKDSTLFNFNINIEPLPDKLELSDSVICFSDQSKQSAFFNPTISTYENMIWYLDGKDLGEKPSSPFSYTPKSHSIFPGTHTITCKIVRGTCTTSYSRQLIVHGPIAYFKHYEDKQCFESRPITFIDSSLYVNQKYAKYFWTVYDDSAPRCTTDRVKGKNIGGNCIYSTDYFHTHKFKNTPSSYRVTLKVYDSLTGCTDSSSKDIITKLCSPLLDIDTFDICSGEIFGDANAMLNPKFVSLDSGKTWVKFPTIPNKKLHGLIDVGFIWETILPEWVQHHGDSSIKVRYDTLYRYDTVWRRPYLNIHSINSDSITFTRYGVCKPFRLTVKFNSGYFYAGQQLSIDWGNGNPTDLTFERDTFIDSFFTVYNTTSINALIKLKLSNEFGCNRSSSIVFKAGKALSIQNPKDYFCKPTTLCLNIKVTDFYRNITWDAHTLGQNVSVQFPDTIGLSPGDKPCHYFKSAGYNHFKIFIKDDLGCTDTLRDSIFVQNLKADIRINARYIYCNELKQFFDSSQIINYPGEKLVYFNWDFGSGTFTNPVKDPFKSLSTSANEIEVVHVVGTQMGCVDTLRYKLSIIGSKPYFRIPDTIACNSLNAVFKNLSHFCSGYIWEFGDEDNNIFPIFDTSDVSFNYLKPGRYHIKLNGYDSFYNPATNSNYFCNTVFPDPIFQRDSIRAVVVLPQNSTYIKSLDTVCVGTTVNFISGSDPFYDKDSWMFDQIKYIRNPGDTIPFSWQQEGTYRISLWPKFDNQTYDRLCSDSASKDITVVNVKAAFDIDPNSKPPYVNFINRSEPMYADRLWLFDTSNSIKQTSTELHPQHNYGVSVGEFDACLIVSSGYGCADTTCKRFSNDIFVDFMIYNVFTPGNLDGKNDRYDILIKGEKTYHLRIYNRWGTLVYEGFEDGDNSNEVNWNGKLHNDGPDCPSGTYYYIFEYTLEATPDKQEMVNGTVTLIR